jgi:hypothetical protein
VLSQGVKGIAEMRQAAEVHCNADGPPPTPLFGMIHFRRRKLLVKLVLEGASRLIQGWFIRHAKRIADLLERALKSIGARLPRDSLSTTRPAKYPTRTS